MFDVSGTLVKLAFIDKILVPYYTDYHRNWFEDNYETLLCKEHLRLLREEANNDANAPKVEEPVDGEKHKEIDSACEYLDYCIKNNIENKAVVLLRFTLWFDGLDKKVFTTPVYSDVAVKIQKWCKADGIKLFILSRGWSEATKKFLEKTSSGDLAKLITDYFDTSYGPLNDEVTFRRLLVKINEKASDVIFLTKSKDEARAAKQAGMNPILVLIHRKDVEDAAEFIKEEGIPYVRTFLELRFVETIEADEKEYKNDITRMKASNA